MGELWDLQGRVAAGRHPSHNKQIWGEKSSTGAFSVVLKTLLSGRAVFQTCAVLKCCCCCQPFNQKVNQPKSLKVFFCFFLPPVVLGKIQNRSEGSVLRLAPVQSLTGIGGEREGVVGGHVEGGRCSRLRQTERPFAEPPPPPPPLSPSQLEAASNGRLCGQTSC